MSIQVLEKNDIDLPDGKTIRSPSGLYAKDRMDEKSVKRKGRRRKFGRNVKRRVGESGEKGGGVSVGE